MKKLFLLFVLCLPSLVFSQTISKYIVIDQFGYRPDSEKVAVIRNPVNGFDAAEAFTPGSSYSLVNAANNTTVHTGNPVAWNGGEVDESSGDKAWWFDFSAYQTPGTYYVLDVDNNVRSYEFAIEEHVYAEVLKHAVRTFFYQRAGFAKEAQYAGDNWADDASHLDFRQDSECRKYDDRNKSSLERDLQGGWYDAGDYNKYTPWTSNYIVDLLKAYKENPLAWGDNYCLPHSDNGIPDIIDEVKWGLDYLLRLQESDGSLISIVSLGEGSPPSSATAQSLYGGVNTTSTLAAAAAYGYGAKIFEELGMTSYSNILLESATKAWGWAEANPNVIWKNNDAAFNSLGIGGGQQEADDYGRLAYKMRAAVYLYEATENPVYKSFIENNYQDIHLIAWTFTFPFEQENQEILLYYSSLSGATPEVVSTIRSTYEGAMGAVDNFVALNSEADPYMAHLKDYVWGSNHTKSRKGLMYMDYINHSINSANDAKAQQAAERYIHYLHGVNPLSFCYLSNMYRYGADNGVNQFYHTWFSDGTDWNKVGSDPYGPAPGYVVGGPNPSYDWDDCCLSSCSGQACDPTQRARVKGQPKQKAYDDFNTGWPMNSWSVTENSCGYQTAYIRLLANFVNITNYPSNDCGLTNTVTSLDLGKDDEEIALYPNPTDRYLNIQFLKPSLIRVYNIYGAHLFDQDTSVSKRIDLKDFPDGMYFIQLLDKGKVIYESKIVKTKD